MTEHQRRPYVVHNDEVNRWEVRLRLSNGESVLIGRHWFRLAAELRAGGR
jgi:hypothetical protein